MVAKPPRQALKSLVEPPWPLSCPFEIDEEADVPPEVLFSDDGSRVAVYREGSHNDFSSNGHLPRIVEVWDRARGLIGQVDSHVRLNDLL